MAHIRRGSIGPQPCIVCGIGVRGKYNLCVTHGGKKYRDHNEIAAGIRRYKRYSFRLMISI